jgi:hypothetical protein
MIQLSKNQSTNTVAFYPNIIPVSGSNLLIEYTQSFNKNSGSFGGQIISNPQNTPYVIAEIGGAGLPDATGQYILNSFETTRSGSAIWNLTIDQWQLAITPWDDASGTILGEQISVDRAFISGSDVEPITQYVSPDEDAFYTTYLG